MRIRLLPMSLGPKGVASPVLYFLAVSSMYAVSTNVLAGVAPPRAAAAGVPPAGVPAPRVAAAAAGGAPAPGAPVPRGAAPGAGASGRAALISSTDLPSLTI